MVVSVRRELKYRTGRTHVGGLAFSTEVVLVSFHGLEAGCSTTQRLVSTCVMYDPALALTR